MGGHPQHVCSRVGGRGRHRALRCRGVAVRARRQVRAVPDLRQRTLALRTAPRGHRSRLPAHVRRPYARSKDAAVTSTLGRQRPQPLLETAQIAAGVVPLRRVYDLRHAFATFALRAGISTFDLSRYMGASLTMIDRLATSHATDASTRSGSSTATRTSKPPTSRPWTSDGRRGCPSSPVKTTETGPEQEETESPLTDSNRRPPPYQIWLRLCDPGNALSSALSLQLA